MKFNHRSHHKTIQNNSTQSGTTLLDSRNVQPSHHTNSNNYPFSNLSNFWPQASLGSSTFISAAGLTCRCPQSRSPIAATPCNDFRSMLRRDTLLPLPLPCFNCSEKEQNSSSSRAQAWHRSKFHMCHMSCEPYLLHNAIDGVFLPRSPVP